MDSLYKKFLKYFKVIFGIRSGMPIFATVPTVDMLNINVGRDGYDTLVKQGIFLKHN